MSGSAAKKRNGRGLLRVKCVLSCTGQKRFCVEMGVGVQEKLNKIQNLLAEVKRDIEEYK